MAEMKQFNPRELKLCVLLGAEEECLETAEKALRGGALCLQYRGKAKPGGVQAHEANKLRTLTRRFGAYLIINDRVDIARLADADGVHLGAKDLPIRAARKVLHPGCTVGATAHGVEEARAAEHEGADYLGCGAVFETTSKPGLRVLGLGGLAAIVQAVSIPVLGIGGVSVKNAGDVLAQGATGVAVLSAVSGAPDVTAATQKLHRVLKGGSEQG